jgi:acyl-CoA synthetase (AMP-forming)/AMP-acid ligase II
MLNVRDALRRSARYHRNRVAVIDGRREITYQEAWARGLRLANALLELGLRPGDRAAVLEDNSVEASDFLLGTAAANLVRVPLYRRNSPEAHAHMLRHTGCRALVVDQAYVDEVKDLVDELPDLDHLIIRDAGYESWLLGHSTEDPDPRIDLNDFTLLRHSAGTTGVPKGIAFSHLAWMNMQRDWTHPLPPIELGDHCTHVGPISHGSGYLFIPTWLAGGRNILEKSFDGPRMLRLLEEKGGYAFAVPTMIVDLLAAARATGETYGPERFADLKAIVVSGAPIRAETTLAARDLFGDRLYQLYGQTEAVPAAFMGPKEWFAEVPGSQPLEAVGRNTVWAELEIRDENNRPLPANQPGEVAIRCDGQMVCIWNEPELNERRMVGGWVLTGDIGRLDENGYLYLLDRKDDMIISGGFNIWPAELETVISALPGVVEVVVFGVPSERWGESPMAVVVTEQDVTVTEADVIDACRARLGSYKKPAFVVVQSRSLPRTPVGKVSRKAIRERFWTDDARWLGGS